ncbi:cytochrome c biogenesis protein CcdA [Rhodoplanes serenus]|uniref:Cytochrome c biogenesis protein CcdA n=1 Tax=Rhodoplanes serenus TaxID=200615 RepID=A0A9X5ARJ5_9BRAD|nr:cytochrome c biogenesis protein CcdA [Rhodoplanes serenus]MTW16397.1 cytochrome c biogenesis protein CcdA [Rhodoplanes serenus]
MTDVSLLWALLAGIVSFLSPCVLPLVPPYLVYLAGSSLERVGAEGAAVARDRRDTVAAALVFVAGFSTVFVALGASASLIGALLRAYSGGLSIVAGLVIIGMGLHFLGLTRIDVLMRERRLPMPRPVGLWGAYAMGLAFAFGWTPCIGPILAAILAVAASKDTVLRGAGLLAVYSVGLGLPFVAAAFAVEPFTAFLARFKHRLALVEKAMGVLMILTGLAFLFGLINQASFLLLEWFPILATIG